MTRRSEWLVSFQNKTMVYIRGRATYINLHEAMVTVILRGKIFAIQSKLFKQYGSCLKTVVQQGLAILSAGKDYFVLFW